MLLLLVTLLTLVILVPAMKGAVVMGMARMPYPSREWHPLMLSGSFEEDQEEESTVGEIVSILHKRVDPNMFSASNGQIEQSLDMSASLQRRQKRVRGRRRPMSRARV